MQHAILLCLIGSVVFTLLPSIQGLNPSTQPLNDGPEPIVISVENRFLHRNVLMAQQGKRLAKWGGIKTARSWPKYHPKFLEGSFKNDFLVANVSFGTPNQDFVVMMSSGSTRAWVLDKAFSKNKLEAQHTYDFDKSSSAKKLDLNFTQQDGTFNVSGQFYTDHMQFNRAKINNQAFGSITEIDEENSVIFPVDGVFGFNHLAKHAYQNGEPTAPIDNLLKPLIKQYVTLYIGKAVAPSKGNATGKITVGAFDSYNCKRESDPVVAKLVASPKADFRLTFNVVDFHYGYSYGAKGVAYVDTSFSNLILPLKVLHQLYGDILPDYDWDTGLYTVPCTRISYLRNIEIFADEKNYFTVKPQSYAVDLDLYGGNCALTLELNNSGEPEDFILGTPLARSQCLVFDLEEDKIWAYEKERDY